MKLRNLILFLLLVATTVPLYAQITIGNDIGIDYANPKEYEIGGITFSGLKYMDQNVLLMLSGLTVGDRIMVPGERITNSVRKLWDQGFFEDIRISVTGIYAEKIFLEIYLKERPRLAKFAINGVKKSDVDNIREKIKLVSGDYVTDNLVLKTKNIISNYYTDKGYLNCEVDTQIIKDTGQVNQVTLVFNINRHGKVKVYQINVHDNQSLTNEQIKAAFKKTKEISQFNPMNDLDLMLYHAVGAALKLDFIGMVNIIEQHGFENVRVRIFKSSKFIEEDYQEDKVTLISKYNALGYRDARIIRDSISKNEDNTINVDIWVEEGPKYYIRSITWMGNTKYPDFYLSSFLKVKKGMIYNKEALEQALSYDPGGGDLRSLYMDDGYLFFDVVPVEVRVENDSVDLQIQMHEGSQATVGKVTITGNTKTNDHVALREIQTRPGQLFSRDRLIRSQQRLSQLRYFDPEKLSPNVNPKPEDGTVDIDYNVEETSADQIELSGGWGYGRIVGTLGLSFNNFSLKNILKFNTWKPIPSGDGQKLSIRVQTYGKGYLSYSFSFTEPWLGGKKPIALSLSYVHSKYTNGKSKHDPGYGYFIIDGVTVGLGTQLRWPDDYFSLYQTVNYYRYNTKNYSAILAFGGGNGDYNSLSYGVTLTRNSVDAPIFPKTGSEISLALELTPPYSLFKGNVNYDSMPYNERFKWVEYYKWKIKGSWYINLVGKLVLTPRLQFGYLGTYNQDLGTTPFERFYLGGDGLTGYNNMDGRELIGMRGYANNSLTPGYPTMLGGTVYSKNTLELRYPISLNPSATIYVLGFVEAGNDWLLWKNVNPFNLYRSVGLGVRVFLPMFGLLGLDWGYGLDEVPLAPNASGSQFHFSINSSID
jgi:outer membrane protein insertion porin family